MNWFRKDESGVYRAANLAQFAWLEHGFGSRHSPSWLEGKLTATLDQIHSATVHTVDGKPGNLGQGDALISATPGVFLVVRTADCLPVILADPVRRAIGVIHCGWRGTVQNIAKQTVQRMQKEFGCSAQDLHAAIGPGIGACCFEVGMEVAMQFAAIFPELTPTGGKAYIDLAMAVRRQLLSSGLLADKIASGAPCTKCRTEDFYSWRRDRNREGRMLSAAAIR